MGEEASEMSSVQSAWEDLVAENPNRPKLEACLLTTIMLVVLCIFALLTYVYVQLQPAGNVVTRPLYWKTVFADTLHDRQFAYRLMGWMNWSSTRCLGFSEWACGGRLVEASSLAVYETAEMAAETYAKEYTIELMDRNDAYYTTSPTSDYSNLSASDYGVPDNSFMALTQFFRSCRRGYPTMKEFVASYNSTFGLKFVTNADASQIWTLFKKWQKDFSYYPLGDMYLTTMADKDSKLTKPDEDYITVEPIRMIGRLNDKSNKRYQAVVEDGFRSINLAVKGCCGDNGAAVTKFEKTIFDELDKETIEDIDLGLTGGPRIKGPQVDMCWETNTLTTNPKQACRYRQKRVAEAMKDIGASGADAINWAVLKFFIMLAPLMPPDDPDLKNFFKVVAWYHRRAEMPHRDLLCMDLAAKFFPHALEALFAKDDFLNSTKTEMLDVLSKLDAEFGGAGGKSSGTTTVFTSQLFSEKSPFNNKAAKKMTDKITENWKAGYDRIVFFGPPDPHRANVPRSNSTDPLQLISDVLKNTPGNNGSESWLGSRFSGDPYYDIRKDRIFAPIGLAMPPYYHFDGGGKQTTVKHSMPAYATKLCKALVERFVKGFYRAPIGGRQTFTPREPETPIGIPPSEQQRISQLIGKDVACFGKEVSPQLMWDIYFTKSGISLAYQIWRKGYNHATANTDTQLRINYIKFMSEEMLFFVTAANGICNVANPALAAKKDVELAPKVVNSVVHCALLGDTMLCDPSRAVFKPTCSGLFSHLARADEALFTVEAWRKSKKVKWSY